MSAESATSPGFKVFAVDDDPVVLDVVRSVLEPDCAVTTFASAEDCRHRLAVERPDMFLLDIGLPGIDGYAFCRQLKEDPVFHRIPVTFVSSYDTIDARLQGYDAGAEDFIVKPFEPPEMLRKIRVAQQIADSQRALVAQLEAAESLSSQAMAGMDETGLLLQFMGRLGAWNRAQEIAAGLLELLQAYRLDGVLQTRLADGARTLSAAGADLPLQASVIEHVRRGGRIAEFHKRSVHNFERITLMINNLPLEDPGYCARLRDYLAIAVQGADSRLKAIADDEDNRSSQAAIELALASVAEAIKALDEASRSDGEPRRVLVAAAQDTLQILYDRLVQLRNP